MKKSFLFLFSLLGLAFANAREVDMSNPLFVTADCDSIEARGLIGYSYLKIEDSDKPLVINYFQSYRELIPEDHESELDENFVWPSWGDISYTPLTLTNDELYIGRDIIFERDYQKYSHTWGPFGKHDLFPEECPGFGVYEKKNKLIFTDGWINRQKIRKLTFGPEVTTIPEYHDYTWERWGGADTEALEWYSKVYTRYGRIYFYLPPDEDQTIYKLYGNGYQFETVRLECRKLSLPEKLNPHCKLNVLEIGPECELLDGYYYDPQLIICEAMTPPVFTRTFIVNPANPNFSGIVVPDDAFELYKNDEEWGRYKLIKASDYAASIDKVADGEKCDVNLSRGQISVSCESQDTHVTEIFASDGSLIFRGNNTEVAVPEGLVIVRHAGKVSKYIN